MSSWYYLKLGGHWPDDGSGGGYGHVGFTTLNPAEFNAELALSTTEALRRYQPKAGGPRTTATVSPAVEPAVDLIWYGLTEPSTWANGGGGFLSAYRIYVRNPAGVEVCVYSNGQPQKRVWVTNNHWEWQDDTDSPYYMASGVGVIPAGWGYPSPAQTPSYFTPNGGGTWLYATIYYIVKSTAWDVGQWRIRVWTQCRSPVDNPDPGPWFVEDGVTWSFTVGGYETNGGELIPAEVEEVPAWAQPFDLFGAPTPTPPVVDNVIPATGTSLLPTDSVSLDVTDDSGAFRRIILTAQFAGLDAREVIHDGDSFSPLYADGSTRTAITGGWRYVLARRNGWPTAPTITPYAIDEAGAENA